MADTRPVALITGASRGLGAGVARKLAEAGFSLAINFSTNREAANEVAGECDKLKIQPDQRFLPVQGDISSPRDRAQLLDTVLGQLGRLDALVNNAGIAPRERRDILEATEESFEEVIRTNLQGPYFLTQAVARHWISCQGDSLLPGGYKVVFVSSISADTASMNRGEYCISKAGIGMAAQLWALRLADHGIQVYELRPGIMLTDMTSAVKDKYDNLIRDGLVPQKRWGNPEDVGSAVRALLAGDFAFSTGAVIHVDGGLNLRRL